MLISGIPYRSTRISKRSHVNLSVSGFPLPSISEANFKFVWNFGYPLLIPSQMLCEGVFRGNRGLVFVRRGRFFISGMAQGNPLELLLDRLETQVAERALLWRVVLRRLEIKFENP